MTISNSPETNLYLNSVVYIIDDDIEIRNGLQWLLESVKLNVQCFESANDFLENYDSNCTGCIVTDVRMPFISGLQLLKKLANGKHHLPVIVITGHGDIPMAVNAMKLGAMDFIPKPFNDQYLLEQIQNAILKSAQMRTKLDNKTAQFDELSKREKQILDLIAVGKLNKQIAEVLNISISTVEFHRARLMKKMNARNIAELIKNYLETQEQKRI